MTITITTNNQARPVLCGADLTPKERSRTYPGIAAAFASQWG